MPAIRRGFTRTELVVVLVVLTLATAVGAQVAKLSRAGAAEVQGAETQRFLGSAQLAYANENDLFYAGPNDPAVLFAAGLVVPADCGDGVSGQLLRPDRISGDTTPTTPTSTVDWISPSLGRVVDLPVNRAERLARILNRYRCPAATRPNDRLFFAGFIDDEQDFLDVVDGDGFGQVSFLSPAGFHILAREAPSELSVICRSGVGRVERRKSIFPSEPVVSPTDFLPRYDRIQNASGKVLVTDGTRFLAGTDFLDIDLTYDPSLFGNALCNSPILPVASAWRRPGTNLYAGQDNLSIRHRGNTLINTFRFDGSSRPVVRALIYGDASLWHPRGSTFTGENATPEALANYQAGESIN